MAQRSQNGGQDGEINQGHSRHNTTFQQKYKKCTKTIYTYVSYGNLRQFWAQFWKPSGRKGLVWQPLTLPGSTSLQHASWPTGRGVMVT